MAHVRLPSVSDTSGTVMMNACGVGREELKKLGPLSRDEKITAGALGLTVALWVFGGQLGIGAVAAALLGLAVLLITNVVTWKECLSDNQARPSPLTCPSLTLTLTLPLRGLAMLLITTWSPGRTACPSTRHVLCIAICRFSQVQGSLPCFNRHTHIYVLLSIRWAFRRGCLVMKCCDMHVNSLCPPISDLRFLALMRLFCRPGTR